MDLIRTRRLRQDCTPWHRWLHAINKLWPMLLLACLTTLGTVQAQTDSTANQIDSLNAETLRGYQAKLAAIEAQRLEDSLLKADLEKKLSALRTTDNLQKDALMQQLAALKDKEAQRLAEKRAQIDSLRLTALSAPVKGFFGDTLFLVYCRLGSFSTQERAAAIEARIHQLTDVFAFNKDSITVVPNDVAVDVSYKESVLISVTENDALWNNTTREELAAKYREIIGAAVANFQAETSWQTLSREIALALLVLVFMALGVYAIIRLFRWTAHRIDTVLRHRLKGIKIRRYTLMDADRQTRVLLYANKVLKWVLIVNFIYLALPVLFGIFPWTESLATTLVGYLLDPLRKIGHAVWNYLPNLITLTVITVVFRYLLKGLRFLKLEIERGVLHIPGFYADWANPTYQIVRILMLAMLLVVIFPYLPGSNSPVFQGVSVFLGFLLTFGSAGSLSNVIAGLVITYMRLFKIGDRVKIGDVVGDVMEKSLLVTRIKTIKNEMISIPNAVVMNGYTTNYSAQAPTEGLILNTSVTIGYDVPWRKMHSALITAAGRCQYVLAEPAPFVLQTSLDDFYVAYQLNAYTREANRQANIYSELHGHIQDVCNEQGIEILSPHYRAARDGNASTIPASYLPPDYRAPKFGVEVELPPRPDQPA